MTGLNWHLWLRTWLRWADKTPTGYRAVTRKGRLPIGLVQLEDRVVPANPPWAVSMAGDGTQVVFSPEDAPTPYTITAYEPEFVDGTQAAVGDVTGDGTSDLVTMAGFRGGPRVIVFDGTSGQPVRTFFAFDAAFRGGGSVAVGDINGDGRADIAVGAGPTGGPHVRAFDGRTGEELASFLAYASDFRGGVRVAAGDVTGDGVADIVTAPGGGGASHVRVFDGKTGAVVREFMAFDEGVRGGANVGVGDINRDGFADVIVWEREADAFHPNQKPVHALYPLLGVFAPAGGTVLDPFMGSGSTLRAAKDMGLSAVGIEVEGGYCRRAVARLAQGVLFPRGGGRGRATRG